MQKNEQITNQSEKLDEVVLKNMNNWLEALKSKDPKVVAELYSNDCLFLPTVSGDFRKGRDQAEDYFVHFLAKNPEGEVTEGDSVWLSDDSYLEAGMYNFEIDTEEGNRQTVNARFSYLWRKEGDDWKVVHHHSSMRP